MNHCVFSPCGRFRYILTHGAGPMVGWCMLNPSMAAEGEKNDPTALKVRGFSKDWGYSAYAIGNTGAFIATQPSVFRKAPDPWGPDNEFWLSELAKLPLVVVAWGAHAQPLMVTTATRILRAPGRPLFCLGTNANGSPKHPLYVSYREKLREWV